MPIEDFRREFRRLGRIGPKASGTVHFEPYMAGERTSIDQRQGAFTGLTLASTQSFGEGYARTLAEWRRRFLASWPSIQAMGFDERFRRLWEYYLCYCEAGFRAGTIDVGFFGLRKPEVC